MERASVGYEKEWNDYKDRKAKGCAGLFVFIPCFALLLYVLRTYPDFANKIFFGFFVVGGIYYLLTFTQDNSFKCPRCGSSFDWSKRMMSARYCVICALPIYYGSSHFYPYWGPTYGKALADKVAAESK